jgi:hypothetical protein
MATELKSLKGQFHSQKTNEMENTEMLLTRFSGGKEGMKLQLTLRTQDQDELFTHIALNKEQIKVLISELQENFDLK